MARLRIRYTTWPHPRLEVTDTPDPNCRECDGKGGWTEDYGDYDTGEYAGTDSYFCSCWNPNRVHRLLRIPRWAARRWLRWSEPVYSDEQPF